LEIIGAIASDTKKTNQTFESMKNQDPTKICFILGMMPRTGTNWVHNILQQSDSIGDIGPIWEDNLLNQIEVLERAAKMIAGTWNPKWRAADEELRVQQLTDHLQKNLESGLEKFIVQQFRPDSCTNKPDWLVLKSPNAFNVIPPLRLLHRNKCIILIRNPHDLISSGMSSFGWSLLGSCNRYIKASKSIIKLNNSFPQCTVISFEDLNEHFQESVQHLFTELDLPVPSIQFLNLAVRGQSSQKASESISWTSNDLTTEEKIQNHLSRSNRLSYLQNAVISELCAPAGEALGYSFSTQKTPSVVRWSIRVAFRSFCFVRKLKG